MNNHELKQGKIEKQNSFNPKLLKAPLTYSAKAIQAIKKYNEYLMSGFSPQEARIKTAIEMILTREELNELVVNSDYFNNKTLQFLAKENISNAQYQKMQRIVQKAVEETRQDGLLDEAIKSWVNKLIQRIMQEYDCRKSITLKHWILHWASYVGYKNNTLRESKDTRKRIKKQSFSYTTTFSNPNIKLPGNLADIQLQLDQTISVLASLPSITPDSIELTKQKLKKEITELAKVLMGIAELTNSGNQEVTNG